MANGRHSFVAFYPSDWLGGTARMSSRILRSVYFDVCLYNWDTAKACPPLELAIMLGDVPDWKELVEQLLAMGKLIRNEDGSVENPKAMAEARKALAAWEAMSAGGKARRKGVESPPSNGDGEGASNGATTEPEPEPEPDITLKGNKGGKRVKLAVKPDDVADDVWSDFQSLRRQKRAPLTETALKGIEREATKAGWSLNDALRECCERGWQGFKAEWVNSNKGKSNGNGSRPSGWLS